jgi:hypothetical protein
MKYHRLDGLNKNNVFLTFLETGKAKIKVLTGWVPGEDSLPGLQMAIFLLRPPTTSSFYACGEIAFWCLFL